MSRDNDPTMFGALLAEAVDAHARGDVRATRSRSRALLVRLPADAAAWRVLSYACLDDPRLALTILLRAVAAASDSPNTWTDIASLAQSGGAPSGAPRALKRAAALDPSGAARWRDLGMILNSTDGGPAYLRRSLSIARGDALTLRVEAETRFARGEDVAAAVSARQALLGLPADAGALLVNGLVAQRRQELSVARSAFGRVAAVAPMMAAAWHNLAVAASASGDMMTSDRAMRRALVADPAFSHALLLSGNRRIEVGDVDGAAHRFHRTRASAPGFPEVETNLGMISLLRGDYVAGWRGFSARWHCASHSRFKPTPGARKWNGQTDRKGRLLLRSEPEQALGDTLQFARFIGAAADRVGELIVECAATLHELIGRMPGVIRLVDVGADPGPADWSCGLMDLGQIFAPTLASLPHPSAYLVADPSGVSAWSAQIASILHPRIGLCWRGSSRFRMDRLRSPGLAAMTPLLRRASGHVLSLTFDRRPDEELPSDVADPMLLISDMADTAALISALDLVITSDTAVAHLAGALGRPTWVLLHDPPDWRWLRGRADSPWYSSVRLFRQSRPGDWSSAIGAVLEALDSRL